MNEEARVWYQKGYAQAVADLKREPLNEELLKACRDFVNSGKIILPIDATDKGE